jgi:hypothetical protein
VGTAPLICLILPAAIAAPDAAAAAAKKVHLCRLPQFVGKQSLSAGVAALRLLANGFAGTGIAMP